MSVSVFELEAAGLSAEQIVQVLKTAESERRLRRREQNRINQQNHRSRQPKTADCQQVSADTMTAPSPPFSPPSMVPPNTPSLTPPTFSTPSLFRAVDEPTRPKQSDQFEVFWKAYPRRQGANPKAPARKQFVALVRAGTNPEAIIEGARRCAETDADKIATPYIPQAVKWLRDRRWEDYAAVAESPSTPQPPRPGLPSHEEMLRRHAERNAPKGPSVLGQSASVREAAKTGGAVDLGPISDAGNGRVATLFPETRLGTVYAPSDTSGDSREHSSSNAMARVV